jgi:hypothetical protein
MVTTPCTTNPPTIVRFVKVLQPVLAAASQGTWAKTLNPTPA